MMMMKWISRLAAAVLLIPAGLLFPAEDEEWSPVSQEKLDEFYSQEERSAGISVSTKEALHAISPAFLGVNMSYFITTDEMWKKYNFNEKLNQAGVGSLRYPGGHETGFFHWEHPGVSGYEDLWAPEEEHGNPPYRGPFQTTWVHPDLWETNESFMNFDEFMEVCRKTGAEPIVGINLSSGRKYDRYQEGIDEALRWLRYCREKDYDVTYWFLECEPWHGENNYTFSEEEYIEDVLAYGRAIKAEFPDVKLITNPTGPSGFRHTEWLAGLIRETKEVVDYIDFHWYWAWGSGSFDRWRNDTPMGFHERGPEFQLSYSDAVELVRKACRVAGAPDMGVVVLEWNIAPSVQTQIFSQSLTAIVQGEMLMEYLKANVELTCLWPLVWSSSRDVWPEQDLFPSIVTLDPPYNPTLTMDLFRLLSPVQGSSFLRSSSNREDQLVVSCVKDDKLYLYCLSKSPLRRRVTVDLDRAVTVNGNGEYIALRNQVALPLEVEQVNDQQIRFYTKSYSFNAFVLDLADTED